MDVVTFIVMNYIHPIVFRYDFFMPIILRKSYIVMINTYIIDYIYTSKRYFQDLPSTGWTPAYLQDFRFVNMTNQHAFLLIFIVH